MNPTHTMTQGMGSMAGMGTMTGMNQMLEIFKMQYLMKFLDAGAGKSNASLLTMIVLMGYDQFVKYVPFLFTAIWLWFQKKWGVRQIDKTNDPVLLPTQQPPPAQKQISAYIQFERNPDRAMDPRIDAVMYHVCNLPDVRSLRYNGVEMIPNFKDILMIENDVWFEIINPSNSSFVSAPTNSKEARIEPIFYRLSTYDHDITWLHKFVEETMERYEQEKKNKLGSETYYFDQVTSHGPYSNPSPRSTVIFTKSKFTSNRTLKNIYLRQIEELQNRVEFFMRRRDWYDSKGIPHTLGIVMYGVPGCGKTSTIKGIANETRRHIFNIALSEIKTKEALKDLFYNEQVSVLLSEGKREVLTIPLKHRLYVIEDIDAMDSIVIKRSKEQLKQEQDKKLKIEAEIEFLKQTQGESLARNMIKGKQDDDSDKLDLATLLNVLDGVRETPGRIIILSTNYPERLDEALLRPGRFDMMIEFEKHSPEVLKMHLEKHYDVTLTKAQWERINISALYKKWTPAEVSQILFRRATNINAAIDDLINEDPVKLFKFSQIQNNKETELVSNTLKEEKGTSLEELLQEDTKETFNEKDKDKDNDEEDKDDHEEESNNSDKKDESNLDEYDDDDYFISGGINAGLDNPSEEQLLAEKKTYENLFKDHLQINLEQRKYRIEMQKKIDELESTLVPIKTNLIFKTYKPEDEAKIQALRSEIHKKEQSINLERMLTSPLFVNNDGYIAMNDEPFDTIELCFNGECIEPRILNGLNDNYSEQELATLKAPTEDLESYFPKPLQEFSF